MSCHVTGWGTMSFVCGMAFQCGSTLIKVSLLQVGTRYDLRKCDIILPLQTNKVTPSKNTKQDYGV